MSRSLHRYVLVLLFLALPLALAGCGDDSGTDPAPGDDRQVVAPGVDASLGEETEYLDETATQSALVEADDEAHRYTFDAAALEEAGVELEAGEILLLHGVALRRIAEVRESDGRVTVETSYVTLPEAFEEAEIAWDHEVEFTPEAVQNAELVFQGRVLAAQRVSANAVSWEYEVPPYTVRGELEALGSTARVRIQAIKDLSTGDATAAFTAEGTIESPRTTADLRIEDHETKAFDYSNRGIGGDLSLSIAAAGAGNVGLRFETPQAVIRFPFTIGPIPATLAIKAGMVTALDVIGDQASVVASSDFRWGGDAGLVYDGTTVTATASSDLATPSVANGSADLASAFGQSVSAQWGAVVPIIELGLFGETIVPYIQPELYLRARLTWGPVCQRLKVDYNVDGGMNLQFLGVQFAEPIQEQTIAGPWELEREQESCEGSLVAPDGPLVAPGGPLTPGGGGPLTPGDGSGATDGAFPSPIEYRFRAQ